MSLKDISEIDGFEITTQNNLEVLGQKYEKE
jgi:hypothetical protein